MPPAFQTISRNQYAPIFVETKHYLARHEKTTTRLPWLTRDPVAPSTARSLFSSRCDFPRPAQDPTQRALPDLAHSRRRNAESPTRCADNQADVRATRVLRSRSEERREGRE